MREQNHLFKALPVILAVVLTCVAVSAVAAEAASTDIISSIVHDTAHPVKEAVTAAAKGSLSKPVAGLAAGKSFPWSRMDASGTLATFRGARYRHDCLPAYCPGPDMYALGQLGPGFLRTWTPTGVKGLYARDYAYFQFRCTNGTSKGKWVTCQAKLKAAGASDAFAVKLTRQNGTGKGRYLGRKTVKVGALSKKAHATEYVFYDTLDRLYAGKTAIEVRLVVRRVVRKQEGGRLVKAGANGKDAYASFTSKAVRFAPSKLS